MLCTQATEDAELRRSDGGWRRVLFHLERGPTSAGRNHVGVIDLEAGPLQPLDVVDLRAEDELHADLVDDDGDAIDLEEVVVLLRLVEGEGVLEAGATAAANGDAQRLLPTLALAPEQLADLGGSLLGQDDRGFWRLAHFTKCSQEAAAGPRTGTSARIATS